MAGEPKYVGGWGLGETHDGGSEKFPEKALFSRAPEDKRPRVRGRGETGIPGRGGSRRRTQREERGQGEAGHQGAQRAGVVETGTGKVSECQSCRRWTLSNLKALNNTELYLGVLRIAIRETQIRVNWKGQGLIKAKATRLFSDTRNKYLFVRDRVGVW